MGRNYLTADGTPGKMIEQGKALARSQYALFWKRFPQIQQSRWRTGTFIERCGGLGGSFRSWC
jgi:hypothetical protein